MNEQEREDAAKGRFFVIVTVRMMGAVMAALGIAVLVGALDWPQPLGYGLLFFGLVEFFVLPLLMARQWRSPPE